MWIAKQMSTALPGSISCEIGQVTGQELAMISVQGESTYRNLPLVTPWGIFSLPPEEASVLLLNPQQGGTGPICLGAMQEEEPMEPGELRLRSLGGAEIYLKNNGAVVINGQVFAPVGGEGDA